MSRLRITSGIVLSVVMAVLAGCGGSSEQDGRSSGASGAFPVTVEHAFGKTTIKAKPKRIVIVGLTEQDVVLQLGFKPVATTDWYGEEKYAVWPWARDLLGTTKPTVLTQTDGPQYEKIAGLRPDLILGTNAGLDKKTYDKLAKIAPTVAQPNGGTKYFSKWDDQAVLIAKALGKEDEGKALVANVKTRFAKVAKAHPEFAGKTATFSRGSPWDGLLYVYPNGINTEFLTYLGFTITPGLEKYSVGPGLQATISVENLDMIEADVILFATDSKAELDKLRGTPTFDSLKAVRDHRAIYTDHMLAGAIYFMSPLSLEYVLDHLPPLLEGAVEGKASDDIATG